MCNLDVNQSGSDDHYLTKTTTPYVKMRPKNADTICTCNLDNIINTSRMVIMSDCTRNRPRKIILDTAHDNSNKNIIKNKESQLLLEIVFGNFNLSSKANGFKLHIIKNPSKMIVSKIFIAPFSSVYYEMKTNSRKISPDSGNNQSSSSNSSRNSNISRFSSHHSLNSSIINQLPSNNQDDAGHFMSPSSSKSGSVNYHAASTSLNFQEIHKNSDYFFNANYDISHKSSIMMSIVFTFSIPEENRAEFEEFIFHYYVLLESVLNRISQLIADNSYNIFNGRVVNCWKQSKKWLISLLPRHTPYMFHSIRGFSPLQKLSSNSVNVKMFEDVLEYFHRSKRMRFLAQIVTGILLANHNCAMKFFDGSISHLIEVFPYRQILQNLGVNTRNNTFNRIIVKGTGRDKYFDQPSSWKDRLSSSLKFYKNIIQNSANDQRNSSSELDLSIQSTSQYLPASKDKSISNFIYKDVEMLTEFISNLIRPVSTISYQLHILPVDANIGDTKFFLRDNKKIEIEIPLLNDGILLDKEIMPQNHEIFGSNKITDHIFSSVTPIQGFIDTQSNPESFRSQLLIESRHSQITCDDQIFHPDFLVIDVETSTVKIRDLSISPSSWMERLLNDFFSLYKLEDYSIFIGEMYLVSALGNFASKAKLCKHYLVDEKIATINPWLMAQYELTESDLKLFSSIQ